MWRKTIGKLFHLCLVPGAQKSLLATRVWKGTWTKNVERGQSLILANYAMRLLLHITDWWSTKSFTRIKNNFLVSIVRKIAKPTIYEGATKSPMNDIIKHTKVELSLVKSVENLFFFGKRFQSNLFEESHWNKLRHSCSHLEPWISFRSVIYVALVVSSKMQFKSIFLSFLVFVFRLITLSFKLCPTNSRTLPCLLLTLH